MSDNLVHFNTLLFFSFLSLYGGKTPTLQLTPLHLYVYTYPHIPEESHDVL